MRQRRWWLDTFAGVVLGVAAASASGEPTDGCPPEVREALTSWGQDGVHRAAAVVRSEETGIGKPESVFDFSCLSDLFRAPGLDVFVDPAAFINAMLRAVQDFVCEVGEGLYREKVDQPIQEMVFWDESPYVPGVEVGAPWRDKVTPPDIGVRPVEEISAGRGSYRDARWFRQAIGGS